MQSFKDNEGHAWHLALTIGKVRQLREKLGLELLNKEHHWQVMNSETDRLAFVFLLVEDQAKELGLDADAFEERLYGDGIADAASIAFLQELQSFFQRLGKRLEAGLTETQIKVMTAAQSQIRELIESGKADLQLKELENEALKQMQLNSGNGSQNSQPLQD
jgi:hypothetical protein